MYAAAMPYEVRLNQKAAATLALLHQSDPSGADLVEDVLDVLETDPGSCEHEPYPHDQSAAFIAHVLGTAWYVAWVYAPGQADVVLVGMIFSFDD